MTHRDLEGTVGDVLPSKADADDILARLRRRVEDVKRAVFIFHDVHIQLRPLGRDHAARHLAFPGGLGVNCDDRLLADLDSRANAGAFRVKKVRCQMLFDLFTGKHSHSQTHNSQHARSTTSTPSQVISN